MKAAMPPGKWIRICLVNLLLVALLGVILRYKIAFSLPFIDQRNLLHAHSHFAFAGWVSQAIMVLLVHWLPVNHSTNHFRRYHWVLLLNLITAYGMLVSFVIEGYAFFSISFSTLSIFVSYVFCVMFWRDLNKLKEKKQTHHWFKAALIFNVISSLGAFSLAFIMATKNTQQHLYLSSIYFFLHFQYNGWFLFSCLGLATNKLFNEKRSIAQSVIFWLFAGACVPAYLLSVLWLHLPVVLFILVLLAVVAQTTGWGLFLIELKKERGSNVLISEQPEKILFLLSGIAFTIKLLLQLGSTLPSLSDLAFGFRPIVIGYLHLILLGVITIFLVGYMVSQQFLHKGKWLNLALALFISGIIINEIFLMIQGVAALDYTPVPYINECLLAAAALILLGILLLNMTRRYIRE